MQPARRRDRNRVEVEKNERGGKPCDRHRKVADGLGAWKQQANTQNRNPQHPVAETRPEPEQESVPDGFFP